MQSSYQFSDGRKALLNPIPAPLYEPDFGMAFEIVLPITEDDFKMGRGETVWACGDRFTQAARKNNMADSTCFVRVLNDSIHYPKLKHGEVLPIQLRGLHKPVTMHGEIRRFI